MNFNIDPNLNPKLFWDEKNNQPINNLRVNQDQNHNQNQDPNNTQNSFDPNAYVRNNFINTDFPIRPNSNSNLNTNNYFSIENQMKLVNNQLPPLPQIPKTNYHSTSISQPVFIPTTTAPTPPPPIYSQSELD